ncbi:DUF5518 domain-containing protein [Methanobacterium oryzae]|uniref:DUF5518 domain-containing protein n=1 Tax=Methanobacterium oryzae TaxID=69540 RepID=UPI003D1BC209
MINWKAIFIGFVVSLLLGVILSIVIPFIGGIIASFLAGILVGYIVNYSTRNAILNATIMGIFSGFIRSLIFYVANLAIIGLLGIELGSFGIIIMILSTILNTIIAAFGGIIGASFRS